MALQVIESTDPIRVENVTVLIYSDPGVGKSTLANTARSVLSVDWDRGAHRAVEIRHCTRPRAASKAR